MLQYFKSPSAKKSEDNTEAAEQVERVPGTLELGTDHKTPADAEMLDASLLSSRHGQSTHGTGANAESKPILTDEDELFLLQVASDGEPPLLATEGGSGKHENAVGDETPGSQAKIDESETNPSNLKSNEPRSWTQRLVEWGLKPQPDLALQKLQHMVEARQVESARRARSKDREQIADTLKLAADEVKARSLNPELEKEVKEEQKEVGSILNSLNLSSINNRVVGVSHETQKLLEAFNQVLKDIVNGVPTAYDDLEKLLTERQAQLDKLYGGLPPFMKNLVKTIPVKVYAALAPQVAAAMSTEKAAEEGSKDSKEKKKKQRTLIPSLKTLIGEKGAVAGMLRSIIAFLEARFPALLTGTNVVVSLAVFILLFVFWYCHKRGKEARLAKEQAAADSLTDESPSDLEKKAGFGEGRLRNIEEGQTMVIEEKSPCDMTASPVPNDFVVEKDVESLMQRLSEPTK